MKRLKRFDVEVKWDGDVEYDDRIYRKDGLYCASDEVAELEKRLKKCEKLLDTNGISV